MSSQKDEAGWTGKTARRETWAEFDALPVGVKRAYWSAPFDYSAIDAVSAWRNGGDMRRFTVRLLNGMAGDVARESARLLGEAQTDWIIR